jgi:hypothetical protein
MGWVLNKYIDTPENKRDDCRWTHEQKPEETLDMIPSQDFMLDAIRRAYESGDLTLNKRDQQRLEFLYEQSDMGRRVAVLPTDHSGEALESRVA